MNALSRQTQDPVMKSAEDLLRKYTKIHGASMEIDPNLPEEGYCVSSQGDQLVIKGGSPSGVVFGVGRVIREPFWRGCSAPAKKIRGIYFATHFENWYDHASFEELDEYIEHLAIWGCNAIRVWFDMHQYSSIRDPEAQRKIQRLHHIFRKADSLGIMNCLIGLANEAFANSPEELRADWTSGHDGYRYDLSGHYHVELCPSKPGAMELMMKWRGQVLEEFADCNIRYVSMNPYDQGGCTCPQCAPFGANGYLKILPEFAKEVHKRFPKAEVIIDTWRFDVFTDGEWEGFRKKINEVKKYSGLLLVPIEDTEKIKTLPQDFRGAVFMEISMDRNLPWGGFGANPVPSVVRNLRSKMQDPRIIGSFPYSEGIFEDLNKVLILASEWDMDKSLEEIIREYGRFYFGEAHGEAVLRAVTLKEENYGHHAVILQDGNRMSAFSTQKVNPDHVWELHYETDTLVQEKAEECFHILETVREKLDPETANSVRWRMLYLRGLIDHLLAKKTEAQALEKAFLELSELYHCVPGTLPCLIPPSKTKWTRAVQERRNGMV